MMKRLSKYNAPSKRAPAKLADVEAREVETTAVKSESRLVLEVEGIGLTTLQRQTRGQACATSF
jgi:hypothetical protein